MKDRARKSLKINSLHLIPVLLTAGSCAFADWMPDETIERGISAWLATDRVAQMTMKGLSFDRLEHRGALRVAHLSPTGYIILSGSDISDPVISFSRNDFVEPEEGSPFHAMLRHSDSDVQKHEEAEGARTSKWTELIGGRDGSKPKARRLMASPEEDASTILIEPFMTTLWNQWQPWNDFCPVIDPDVDDQLYRARCACGCVATAAAQQIAHCRWPWRTGRTDCWNHTLNIDGEGEAEDWFLVRFDGHIPFDYDSMLDGYSWWWGDARGKIAESERFPVARFVSWVDVITKMNFGKNGSGANFGNTGDSTADWYEAWEYVDLNAEYEYGVAKIKADLEFGVPVHVGVPGHSVIAHGYASDGESDWLYINYGWGGSSDGWYKICDETSSSPVDNAFPGFRPKKMVQLEPLAKVSGRDVEVKWHLPPCYDGRVTGFDVEAVVFGDQTGNETCDFTDAVGIASDPANIYVTNGVEEVRNESDFLWFGSWMSGTYDLPGERILTGGSVLSYRVSSADVGDRDVEILASFDGGAWQTVSKPLLSRNYWSGSWISQEVFLGEHAGETARFRIKVGWSGGRVLFDDFTLSNVIQPSVVFRQTVAPELRTYTVTGFSDGVLAGVSVTPVFADGGGIRSECEFTRIAGGAPLPVPATITEYTTNDVVYTNEAANDTWSLRGIADGETTIRAHNAWSGGFDVALPGRLTEHSTLSFSWYETGCYALDTEYDTMTVTFADDTGEETAFWCMTNQNQQTERQFVEIPLSRFAGKTGGIKLVFGHSGVNYVGDGDIMRFYSPRISHVAIPVLPEARWESKSFATLPRPRIDSIKGRDGMEIDEGLYREIGIGEDWLRVTCSETVTNLCAYPSHLSLMDDEDVQVEAEGNGVFTVRMNTARGVRRSRMILTLAATDANGTTAYRDVSLRFDTPESVSRLDMWRKLAAEAGRPVAAFSFDNSDCGNSGTGAMGIGGGNVSYIESPLGHALYHNGDDGPWNGERLNLPQDWTILTIAELSDTDNAVLFQFGSSESGQSGFALASGGKDRVTLSHWKPRAKHVDLLSAYVPNSTGRYHEYALRAHGKEVELYVDGSFAGCAVLPSIPEIGFQLFSVIQGNGDTGLTYARGEVIEDWRMYDCALSDTALTFYADTIAAAAWPDGWYTVAFDAGDAEGSMPSIRCAPDDNWRLPPCAFVREGYAFAGWAETSGGAVKYADGEEVARLASRSGETVTLHAVWTVETYAVEYDGVVFTVRDGVLTKVELNGASNVVIPYGVTSIADNVFRGMNNIVSVSFPASLTWIGNYAFSGCGRLCIVEFEGDAPAVGQSVFENTSSGCTAYVHRASTGWGTAIPGTWQGISIACVEDAPPVPPDVTGGTDGGDNGGTAPAPLRRPVWTAKKAVTLDGAVYDAAGNVAGVIQLKVAKPNAKKHNAKVSGSVTLLDGMKRTLKATTVNVPVDAPIAANLAVKGLGTLSLAIGDDGFEGSVGGYTVAAAKVGGAWTQKDARVYAVATSATLPSGTVEALLPDGVPVRVKGGKWAFDKAAAITYKKGVLGGDSDPKKPNRSAMKLTYTPKTGLFKGSFKVYAVQGGKLKKYTVKVTGVVVDGEGTGVGKLAKPSVTWRVRVSGCRLSAVECPVPPVPPVPSVPPVA